MTCPVCGEDTKVYYTASDNDCVYRERACISPSCGYVFVTEEIDSKLDRHGFNQILAKIRATRGETDGRKK